jgi:hypothetical protein
MKRKAYTDSKCCARDMKGQFFLAMPLYRQKNRNEVEPGMARPGAQSAPRIVTVTTSRYFEALAKEGSKFHIQAPKTKRRRIFNSY